MPKRKKKDAEMCQEGVPQIIYHEEDGQSDGDGVAVDEIALVAVPMPAFAEDMISQNASDSDHESENENASQIEVDHAAEDQDQRESEGEGQGFEESD